MAKLGELPAELRQDKKMTQRELADKLHVFSGAISNYEKGVHFPDLERLINLADYFRVTIDYLPGRCESNLSSDVFKGTIAESKTIGEFICVFKQLDAARKDALILIMDEMEFHIAINRRNKKGN
ncbi:HTH-type transcriptional regulator ImmR [bioreactor metagenome]|uniref:HTH-type transcriptional regulator ImmR n=1 Tax=bioreactor metagenome TaxID=1076179 RepID=A0A644XAE6_9ZZZZ